MEVETNPSLIFIDPFLKPLTPDPGRSVVGSILDHDTILAWCGLNRPVAALFANIGTPICPTCRTTLISDRIDDFVANHKRAGIGLLVLGYSLKDISDTHSSLTLRSYLEAIDKERVVVEGRIVSKDIDHDVFSDPLKFLSRSGEVFVVVEVFSLPIKKGEQKNVQDSVKFIAKMGGKLTVFIFDSRDKPFSAIHKITNGLHCENCGLAFDLKTFKDEDLPLYDVELEGVLLSDIPSLTAEALLKIIISHPDTFNKNNEESVKTLIQFGFKNHPLGFRIGYCSTGECVRLQLARSKQLSFSDMVIDAKRAFSFFPKNEREYYLEQIQHIGNDSRRSNTQWKDVLESWNNKREKRKPNSFLSLKETHHTAWKGSEIVLPLGVLLCICGRTGSGKTILLRDIISGAFRRGPNNIAIIDESKGVSRKFFKSVEYFSFDLIKPRKTSTLISMLGLDKKIASFFAATSSARQLGLEKKNFTTQSNSSTTDRVEIRGHTISSVMTMSVKQAALFFANVSSVFEPLRLLETFGYGERKLSEPHGSFLFEEKTFFGLIALLAPALSRRSSNPGPRQNRPTLFLLDYPFLFLDPAQYHPFITLLYEIIDKGHSIICIDNSEEFKDLTDCIFEIH